MIRAVRPEAVPELLALGIRCKQERGVEALVVAIVGAIDRRHAPCDRLERRHTPRARHVVDHAERAVMRALVVALGKACARGVVVQRPVPQPHRVVHRQRASARAVNGAALVARAEAIDALAHSILTHVLRPRRHPDRHIHSDRRDVDQYRFECPKSRAVARLGERAVRGRDAIGSTHTRRQQSTRRLESALECTAVEARALVAARRAVSADLDGGSGGGQARTGGVKEELGARRGVGAVVVTDVRIAIQPDVLGQCRGWVSQLSANRHGHVRPSLFEGDVLRREEGAVQVHRPQGPERIVHRAKGGLRWALGGVAPLSAVEHWRGPAAHLVSVIRVLDKALAVAVRAAVARAVAQVKAEAELRPEDSGHGLVTEALAAGLTVEHAARREHGTPTEWRRACLVVPVSDVVVNGPLTPCELLVALPIALNDALPIPVMLVRAHRRVRVGAKVAHITLAHRHRARGRLAMARGEAGVVSRTAVGGALGGSWYYARNKALPRAVGDAQRVVVHHGWRGGSLRRVAHTALVEA